MEEKKGKEKMQEIAVKYNMSGQDVYNIFESCMDFAVEILESIDDIYFDNSDKIERLTRFPKISETNSNVSKEKFLTGETSDSNDFKIVVVRKKTKVE